MKRIATMAALTPDEREYAARLGLGHISNGIRRALAHAKATNATPAAQYVRKGRPPKYMRHDGSNVADDGTLWPAESVPERSDFD